MFDKGGKPRTTTLSSVVTEQVEQWVKARAKREGVTPSLWIADVLGYSMMVDGMTKGEFANVIHDVLHLSELAGAGRKFDMNPWRRYVEASSNYAVSRVRKGLQLYWRGKNVPDTLHEGLVTVLANTSDGRDFRPVQEPLSDDQVSQALRILEKNGEVKLENGVVRILQLAE